MSLSCSCSSFSGPGTWYCEMISDFFIVFSERRRKRCKSCGILIDHRDKCLKFLKWREALTEIEERICGEEIQLAPFFLCEKCGEIYLNLDSLGYCVNPTEEMEILLEEYHALTGFVKGGQHE